MGDRANDDCYYYYYSKCTKGTACTFRHCAEALGSETMCPMWLEGRCYATNCKLRHAQIMKDRKSIPCYWESQPGGCQKEHCVFMHTKPRSGDSTRPNSTRPNSTVTATTGDSGSMKRTGSQVDMIKENAVPSPKVNPVLITVDHDDENSNGDKACSPTKTLTPIVVTGSKTIRTKKNLAAVTEPKQLDLGIKSLEQIRKEKESSQQALGSGFFSPTLSVDAVRTPGKAAAGASKSNKGSPASPAVPRDGVVKDVKGLAKQSPVKLSTAAAASPLPKKEQNIQEIRIKTFAEIMEEKRKRKEKELASRDEASTDSSKEFIIPACASESGQLTLNAERKASLQTPDSTGELASTSSASDVKSTAATSGDNSHRVAAGVSRPTASVAPLDGSRSAGGAHEVSKPASKRKSSATNDLPAAADEVEGPAVKKAARSPQEATNTNAVAPAAAAEATGGVDNGRSLPIAGVVGLEDEGDRELDELLLSDTSSGALKAADGGVVVNDEELMREMEVLLQ